MKIYKLFNWSVEYYRVYVYELDSIGYGVSEDIIKHSSIQAPKRVEMYEEWRAENTGVIVIIGDILMALLGLLITLSLTTIAITLICFIFLGAIISVLIDSNKDESDNETLYEKIRNTPERMIMPLFALFLTFGAFIKRLNKKKGG